MAVGTNYQETDTNTTCGGSAGCSGNPLIGTPTHKKAIEGGIAGTTTLNLRADTTLKASLMFEIEPGSDTTWGINGVGGTWTIPINVTFGSNFVVVNAVHVCRFDSACNNLLVMASNNRLSENMTTGIHTFTLTQAFENSHNPEDKIYIIISTKSSLGFPSSVNIKSDQIINAPITRIPTTVKILGNCLVLGNTLIK